MADITESSSGFEIKFHDNGDGTYAPYVALVPGGTIGSVGVEGVYNASPPSLTNGQVVSFQLDSSGRLITNPAPLTGVADSVAINDGTNTANVVAGDSGFNGVATAGATKTYTFTTSASGAQTILANTPCEGFNWIEVVYTSVGSGLALTGQFSTASGGTYISESTFSSSGAANIGLGTSANAIYYGPIHGNFFQIAVSALTSGTFAGSVTLRASAPPFPLVNANQNGVWSFQNGAGFGTLSITSSSSGLTTNSVGGYAGLYMVGVSGTYSGVSFTITSYDSNGNPYNVPIYDTNASCWRAPGATLTPGTNVSNMYGVPLIAGSASKIKIQATAYSSGTANVVAGYSGTPTTLGSTMSQIMDAAGNARGANVDANGNLNTHDEASSATGASVPANAFSQGILAKTTSPTAATTGNLVSVLGNTMGMPVMAQALLNSAVAVSATLTVVKASAGYLSGVIVSAAGTAQALTIYDNASAASGTVIGVIPADATAGQYYPFNMPAANGITCSGSSSNPAITVAYA